MFFGPGDYLLFIVYTYIHCCRMWPEWHLKMTGAEVELEELWEIESMMCTDWRPAN